MPQGVHMYNVKYGKDGNCGCMVQANSEAEARHYFETQTIPGKSGQRIVKVDKVK